MSRRVKSLVLCAAFAAGTTSALCAGGIELAAAALHGDEGTLALELSRGGSLPAMLQAEIPPSVLAVVAAFNTAAAATGGRASPAYLAPKIADRFADVRTVAWQVTPAAKPAVPSIGAGTGEWLAAAVLDAASCGDCQEIAALLASRDGHDAQTLLVGTKAAQVALAGGHHMAAAILVAYEAGRRAALN